MNNNDLNCPLIVTYRRYDLTHASSPFDLPSLGIATLLLIYIFVNNTDTSRSVVCLTSCRNQANTIVSANLPFHWFTGREVPSSMAPRIRGNITYNITTTKGPASNTSKYSHENTADARERWQEGLERQHSVRVGPCLSCTLHYILGQVH